MHPRLRGALSLPNTKQPRDSKQKMARQLFDVVNIEYCCLSNDGHSVRLINKLRKLLSHRIKYKKCFSLPDVQEKNSALISCLSYGPLWIHDKQKFCERGQNKSRIIGELNFHLA